MMQKTNYEKVDFNAKNLQRYVKEKESKKSQIPAFAAFDFFFSTHRLSWTTQQIMIMHFWISKCVLMAMARNIS
ncbi:hypothetical protein MRB53_003599 [Persea americana]|uniref:Uncharacterized protein n=1 Tax=Persea americana TaxID=3435 RepID=A0ACC2MXT0_PERAE|nr:hypothetical protein MRB53_003599 [Persea americana]